MEIRVRKEGGVCSPDPKYQGREGDPPTPVVRGQAAGGGPTPGGLAAR